MKIEVILLFLVLCSFANAIEIDTDEIRENLDKVDLREVPKVLKFILGKPRVNIDVDGELYGFKIAGNRVMDFIEGGIEKPNYVVKIDEETLEKIINSEDIGEMIGELYLSGDIDVEAKTYGSKVKYYFARKFVRWFG